MKWATVGLLALGLVAAACVSLLFASLRADTAIPVSRDDGGPGKIDILVASGRLPPMTVIEANMFVTKTVSADQAPKGWLSEPVQVLGKVLAMRMVDGEAFTPMRFVRDGSGKQLAAALNEGMRAVSVSLSNYSGLDGILYPGSVVDVLVSLKLPFLTAVKGEAVSTTLFQGIQVLGIEDHTIVNNEKGDAEELKVDRGRKRMITLMVNAKQAVILQLAREYGTVSLAMRNPLDSAAVDTGGVLLSELSPEYFDRLARLANSLSNDEQLSDERNSPPASKAPLRWEVNVIRGEKLETRNVPMPEGMGG